MPIGFGKLEMIPTHYAKPSLDSSLYSKPSLIFLLGDPFNFFSNWPRGSKTLRRLPNGGCLVRAAHAFPPTRMAADVVVANTLLFQKRLRAKMAVFEPNLDTHERSLPGEKRDDLRLNNRILKEATLRLQEKKNEDQDEIMKRVVKLEKGLSLVAKQNNLILELLKKK